MIDTLNLRLDNSQFDYHHINRVFDEKMDFKAATRFKNGSSITVHYNNYKFTLSEKSLTATGSLTKLYYGNNIQNLNFNQVQQALMQFESLFEIPFDDAKIVRIDMAHNIQMDKPINMYFDLLTTPEHYKLRLYEGETKYFESSKNKLIFYDKVQEVKKKDRDSYIAYQQQNILKYEISFTKNLDKNLGLPDCTLKNLYSSKVYERLLNKWMEGYQTIPKLTKMLPSFLSYKSLTTFKNSLIFEGIKSLGGIETLSMAINQANMTKNVRYKIKNYVSEFHEVEPFSPLLQQELDNKIHVIYKNELQLLT